MFLRAALHSCSLFLLLISLVSPSSGDGCGDVEGPVVMVQQGQLRGQRIERPTGTTVNTIYTFYGVPYARPPVGTMRFKDPEVAIYWTGIRNATAYGPNCIQKNLASKNVSGEEDCLYLNIFTADPPEAWETVKKPVIVVFHGGAFVQWNGRMEVTHPDPLLQDGVVLVSINYRLGVMGFLNTEDAEAPGNAGLKDQNMALRWVRENIAAFGGDPTQVTIMGESAGGASVHFHVLSPLSRGLFHRAISVSGTVLPTWTHVQRPKERAAQLRKRFASKCSDLPEDAIVPCLQRIPAEDLVFNQYDVPLEQYQNYFLKGTFLPSVEAPSSGNAPFLPAEPEQLLKEGNFARVPYMTGFTSGDGIIFIYFAGLLENQAQWAEVDEHFEDIFRWEMPSGLRTREAARQVRNFYLGNRTLSNAYENLETLEKFELLCTDIFFAAGTVTSGRLMADHGAPVFMYEFSRDGPIGLLKKDLNVTHLPGVVHGDDMVYVYDFTDASGINLIPVPTAEQPIRKRQAQIFTNMAKIGNPTPPNSGLLEWPLFSSQNGSYMEMNVELSVHNHVLGERINFWRRLMKET